MDFADWQRLGPPAAAAELERRLDGLLPAQRRAVIATVPAREGMERRFEAGMRGRPLSGVPCLIKDLFDVAGEPTLAGGIEPDIPNGLGGLQRVEDNALHPDGNFVAALRAAGLVPQGKTNMVEYAFGLTGENSHYGDCVHPRFPDRTSGGSSSGSAVAVAAGIVPFAAASDTGGSIRVPAAFCGIYGMRLAPHHAWIADAVPLAPSFDTAGWFTRSAGDMGKALDALCPPSAGGAAAAAGKGLGTRTEAGRGVYLSFPGLEPAVESAYAAAATGIAPPADAQLRAELIADFAGCAFAYQVLGGREAYRLHRRWLAAGGASYDPAVRARLWQGASWSQAEIAVALATLGRVRRRWAAYFAEHDFLVMAATPFPALRSADLTAENRGRLLALTTPVSLVGLPALTIPVQLAGTNGLTGGLQIVVKDPSLAALRRVLQAG